MDSSIEESESKPGGQLNYFNYFTEVEEEFVRRRGKPLLVSPLDWALIESWKNAGIPLHVVLRAINQAFDSHDSRPRKHRKVNSVFYCQQEVEATFAEYRLAQVGGKPESTKQPESVKGAKSPRAKGVPLQVFAKAELLEFIARSDKEILAALGSASGEPHIESAVVRARARLQELASDIECAAVVDEEALERDLDGIDRMLIGSLVTAAGQSRLDGLRLEAEQQLQPYKKKMDKAIYNQTVENLVCRRLREIYSIPRLSLFYI